MRAPSPERSDRPRSDPSGTSASPTLLVFTLGPAAEGRRRRLLPQALRDREVALYRACLDEALGAGAACGFRLRLSAPGGADLEATAPGGAPVERSAQVPGRFGERLAAAFDAAGPDRDTPVVVVGGDTPGLTPERLRRAVDALDPHRGPGGSDRVVIGPSPDGGLYLLAAARPLGAILRRVPWRRRHTLVALRRALGAAGLRVELLPALADLDRPADLDAWLAERVRTASRGSAASALDRLAAAVARLLATLRLPLVHDPRSRPLPAVVPVRAGRAPPRR